MDNTDITDAVELKSSKPESLIPGYQFLELLGQGGMSVVYKARQPLLNRFVAVKVLRSDLVRNEITLKRFQQEAKAASRLSHTGISQVHDFGVLPGGQPFIIMDYAGDRTLADLLEQEGSLPQSRALTLFLQIASALEHSHSQGILHRDLKPGNVILNGDSAKLVDFGIAKLMLGKGADDQTLTRTGEVFGSPAYMSPEQCLGRDVDVRSDIYSFGCMLYEALSGRTPHQGNTSLELISKQIGQAVKPISQTSLDPRITADFEAVVMKLLQKKPAGRYQNFSQVRGDLERLVAGKTIRRTRNVKALLMIAAFAAAAIAAVLYALVRQAEAPQVVTLPPPSRISEPVGPRSLPAAPLDVRSVSLQNKTLTDEVVNAIAANPKLQDLDISGASVSAPVMEHLLRALANRDSIISLNLSEVWTNDDALAGLGQLKSLTELYANQTSIGDRSVSAVSRLPNLRTLGLGYTMVGSRGVRQIGNATRLQYLDLSGNANAVQDLSCLANLKSLQILSIQRCLLSDQALRSIGKATSVRILLLDENPATDAQIAMLTGLKHLHTLHLSRASITGIGLQTICENFAELTSLKLSKCPGIAASSLEKLSELHQLSALDLDSLPVDDYVLSKMLPNWRRLQSLNLANTKISARSVSILAQAKSITVLDITNTAIDHDGIAQLLRSLPLRQVYVTQQQLTDSQRKALAAEYPFCTFISPRGAVETNQRNFDD